MRIGGHGELENLRKSLMRDDPAQAKKPGAEDPRGKAARSDEVELSSESRILGRMKQVPEVRQERIESIRKEIARGEYLTPERVESGIRKMLNEL